MLLFTPMKFFAFFTVCYFFPKTWASSFDPTPSAPIFRPALVNPLLFVTRPSPVRPAPATILAVPSLKILIDLVVHERDIVFFLLDNDLAKDYLGISTLKCTLTYCFNN